FWIHVGEDANIYTPERVSDQYLGRTNARVLQGRVKLQRDLFRRARFWSGFGLPNPRAIVRNSARELCNVALYRRPGCESGAESGFEDNGRCYFAADEHAETVATGVYLS